MPDVDVTVRIKADIAEVWRAVNDIESYSKFMDNVREVRIVDQPSEHERIGAWSVFLKGSILEWEEREVVDEDRLRIEFTQVDGDLDVFEGHWQLIDLGDGEVSAELSVHFEIGIPLLADMLNPVAARALADNSEQMLREIERQVTAG